MHQLFQLSFWLTRRRLRDSWGLTAATSLGILAAVVLLSATSLYSDLLAEAGVRYALYSQDRSTLDVQVLSENRSLGEEDYQRLRYVAESAIDQHLGPIRTHVERFGRTQWGMPLATGPDQPPPPVTTISGRPFFMTGFREHSRLVEGNWPQEPAVPGSSGVELQSVIGQLAASEMGVEVGSKLYITPFRSSPQERIVLTIVGLAVPLDPRDEFWLGYPSQFGRQIVADMHVYPAYVSEEDFLSAIGRRFPTLIGDFGFNVFVDPSRITARDVQSTQESLEGLETDLNKSYPRTFTFTRLDRTLAEFERDLTLARVPVYVFISLVVVIVLYFLFLIAGILGRSQADELGLLRSRGGSIVQVCGVLLLADGILAAVSVAVGPLIAWAIVRYAMLPAFHLENGGVGGGPIDLGITGEMFWMGAIGAVLALAALTLSAAARARSGVSESLAGRSRPPEVSFMQRYYLDIVAIIVVGVVWWQFGEREGFLTRSLAPTGLEGGRETGFALGGLQTDPTVILGPVLGLLAAALVLLRVLPLAVRLIVWMCLRAGPAWSSFATARMARDPVLPSALAVLLMLSAALGVFGATFQSSMSSSQRDQALYRIGGDVVLSGPGVERASIEELQQIPGVASVTPVLQDTISLTGGQFSFPAHLLAAEPHALAEATWFRDDFSESTLPQLAELMRNPPTGSDSLTGGESAGVMLPTGVDRIGVWLNTAFLAGVELEANINVWTRLRNADGIYNNVSLGGFSSARDEENDYWRFFSGELSERMAREPDGWTVTAIFFTTSTLARVPSGVIQIDDLTVYGPALQTEGTVVESFDDIGRWRQIDILGSVQDVVEWGPESGRSGSAGLSFAWQEPFTGEQRGVQIPPVNLPIPAIGGGGLRQGEHLWIKHVQASIPIRIVGETSFFPTTAKPRQPFVILDIDSFLSYRRFLPSVGPVDAPGQIWLSVKAPPPEPGTGGAGDSPYNREDVISQIEDEAPPLTRVIDRDAIASRAALNPLAGGGWDGLTGLSIAAVGAAVGIASLLYGAAAARATRVDNAVARALGLSARQLFLTLLAERWLMAGAAIAAGAAIGYWPGLQLIQRLEIAPGSAEVLPPMIPQVHELLLSLVLAGLLLAVMGSALYSAVLARRDRPAEVLRT